jgi:hypothetical protein
MGKSLPQEGAPSGLPSEYKPFFPERTDEDFEGKIRPSLEELQPHEDAQKVVAYRAYDVYQEDPIVMTAGELRALVRDMRNPDNPISHGLPEFIWVVSADPDAYFGERNEKLERIRAFELKQLEPYRDDQLLTYIHPNHYTSFETGKPVFYQQLAGELRKRFQEMDWAESEMLSHEGGLKIISDDPNYSLEQMDARILANDRVWRQEIQGVIDSVNNEILAKEALQEAIKGLPDEARIALPLPNGSLSPELEVKRLKEFLRRR